MLLIPMLHIGCVMSARLDVQWTVISPAIQPRLERCSGYEHSICAATHVKLVRIISKQREQP
jgi:hypothetical protein